MASTFLRRFAQAAVLASGVAMVATTAASAKLPVRGASRRPVAVRGFNLFAGAVNVEMNVNRVFCNINSLGNTCVDGTGSPGLGGGFWPKGSPNQYIYNSGLQIAAIVGGTGPWTGDTVGAYFFDARGTQLHGDARTNVFNALNTDDLAAWPTAANVNDTSLFNLALVGPPFGTAPATRQTVSQQDTWVRYWDGNTNLTTGRQHPMGLLVEQRGLAWNFPSGNQDIVYFLYRFINITSKNAADYAGLADAGYSAADIAEIAAIGAEFQNRAESVYNIALPDGGVPFEQMFAAFGQDPDVGNASFNYSTATLPFSIGYAYKSDFLEPTWQFPPSINGAPFAAAPGFEGVKYLKSPVNPATGQEFGITIFTNTTNGGLFPDRQGVQALWRLLSGNLIATDGTCTVPLGEVASRHFCQSVQQASDTRFYESSGPFTLNPGESSVIVVAYIHAAPVASLGGFDLSSVVGGDLPPGNPVLGTRLADGTDVPRSIDRLAGYIGHADANGDGDITQNEINVVPRSLFGKANVAQAVFDARFLLPFAPESPTFFLVPGDNQVTVAWQESPTVANGDPYYNVASSPVTGGLPNALYDPNFRQYDVEGYRIWRGRDETQMEVIASFDDATSTLKDYTAQFYNSDYGNQCAPELGVTATCPVNFATTQNVLALAGDIVQVPPGGRVQLADGTIFIVTADTAVTGGGSGFAGLTDTGIPFAFVDTSVRNGFRYYYAVTAFDVNSVTSGPSSLESPLITKTVTPRAPSSNNTPAAVVLGMFGSDGTTELDPTLPFPSIDPNTGAFSGNIPPANDASFGFLASVAEALPPGDYTARIDSIAPGFIGGIGEGPVLHMTFSAPGVVQTFAIPLESSPGTSALPSFSSAATSEYAYEVQTPLVPYDSARSTLLGISQAFAATARMPVRFQGAIGSINQMSTGTALSQGRYGVGDQPSRFLAHSRWFDEGSSEPADPTIDPFPSKDHNSGTLTGVDSIWAPLIYRVPFGMINANFRGWVYAQAAWYPADFTVTWDGSGGVTVRDVTHATDLPYSGGMASGYGFASVANIQAAAGFGAGTLADGQGTPSQNMLSYHMLYTVDPVCRPTWWNDACAPLAQTTVLEQLDYNSDGVADGQGIVLVINGEAFFMQMAALPAAGTQWHLRAVGGRGMSATCTPALPSGTGFITSAATAPTDCSGYAFSMLNASRHALAPGLQFKIRVTQAFEIASASGDLSRIHTVPDPYYVTNQLEITANTKVLRFVNLPDRAIIRIYSTSGILVNILSHNSVSGGGETTWNLRNRNNQFVASGVYFYHVETPDGREKIGRFTVVNYAQ